MMRVDGCAERAFSAVSVHSMYADGVTGLLFGTNAQQYYMM